MKIEKIFTDAPNQKVIDNAIDCIDKGNIIIIPTDSVYAFACDALNNSAIEKICSIKAIKSDRTNLSIICCDIAQASEYARIDNATFKMMRKNLPGPITFILPALNKLPKAFKGRKTVGIRIDHNTVQVGFENADDHRYLQSVANKYGVIYSRCRLRQRHRAGTHCRNLRQFCHTYHRFWQRWFNPLYCS